MLIKQLMLIAVGGAVGAMMRFLALSSVTTLLGNSFPYGILIINVMGSFFAGVISMLILEKWGTNIYAHSILIIGFLGAFTTFSTFSLDTLMLMQNAEWLKAMVNIFLNLGLCLLATFIGMYLVRVA